jgi:hypothetical protein
MSLVIFKVWSYTNDQTHLYYYAMTSLRGLNLWIFKLYIEPVQQVNTKFNSPNNVIKSRVVKARKLLI